MPVCSGCGKENPQGFAFCGFCRAPLSLQGSTLLEERKFVSVLFVDLVGFTERSDRADPEDVQAMLWLYYVSVRREIEAFGGTVEKFIGDAVVGVFGAPRVHEDDPERAVRSALRVIEAVDDLNAKNPALDLTVRIGVNTGEAVVSLEAHPELGEGFVAGDVVNTASRLQTVARPGCVIVGEATYAATAGVIDYGELDPVRVKGKADPLRVWHALRVSPPAGPPARAGARTPLVGRDVELTLLQNLYGRCRNDEQPHLVTISGEAGTGKSRLLAELRAIVGDDATWRQGQCLPYGEGVTYWALGEVVKQETGILDSDSPGTVSEKVGAATAALIRSPGDRDWIASSIAPLVGAASLPGTEAGERGDSFRAWVAFFEAIATRRPLVVAIEDVHWADQALVEFIQSLVNSVTDAGLFVVCTARPAMFQQHPTWGSGQRNAMTISLGPLSSDETTQLVSSLLEGAALPTDIQRSLVTRSAGNPLYAQEFARMLLDRGLLQWDGGQLVLQADTEIPVPESVHALIAARLDTLTLELKQLAHDAAVVGEAFWPGPVARIQARQTDEVRDGLAELARRELIRAKRASTIAGETEFAFAHVLVRDVAYEQIPRSERIRKHRTAAEWVEEVYGDRVTDAAELLAHHYTSALDLARAVGDTEQAARLSPGAVRFLELSGDRAARLDAQAAVFFYRRALELSAPGLADRARVLLRAGEAAHQAGRLVDATEYYEAAAGEFRAHDDLLGAGETLVRLSRLKWWQGDTDRAEQLLGEGVALLEQRAPGRELALAYARVAGSHATAGRYAQAMEWAERTLQLAGELDLPDVAVRALQYRGLARCEGGDMGGLENLRDALDRGLELGLGHETATAYDNLGDWLWLTEGPRAGVEMNRAGVDFALRRGQTETATWTKTETLWMLFDAGEWDEVLRVADEVVSWDERHGHNQVGVIARIHIALVAAGRGDVSEAERGVAEFLPRARAIGDPEVLVPALTASALDAHAHKDEHGMLEPILELERITEGKPLWRARDLPDVVPLCIGVGRLDVAERLIDGAAQTPTRPELCTATAHALLTEARGDPEAADYFEAAASGWRRFGAPFREAQALLGAARCGSDAETRRAHEIFKRLGARTYAEEAGGLLG